MFLDPNSYPMIDAGVVMNADNFARGASWEHPTDVLDAAVIDTFDRLYRISGNSELFVALAAEYMTVACSVLGYDRVETILRELAEDNYPEGQVIETMANAVVTVQSDPGIQAQHIREAVVDIGSEYRRLMTDMEDMAVEMLYCEMSGDLPIIGNVDSEDDEDSTS